MERRNVPAFFGARAALWSGEPECLGILARLEHGRLHIAAICVGRLASGGLNL
jgi:hypothetical protein